jgi:AcrR family transcriptional regulator
MATAVHPTKALLISTTVSLLDTKLPHQIAVDEILDASKISKGSLYHHFNDLGELLEVAQVKRYAEWVDKSVGALEGMLAKVETREDIVAGLKLITRFTQDPRYSQTRFERSRAIASAQHNPRFKKHLAEEQSRLTAALVGLINEARKKGLYANDFDAHAGAVLVQAYTLGMIVDDFVDNQMDPEAWYALIDKVVEKVFLIQG